MEQLELSQQLVSPLIVMMANNQVAITDKSVMVPIKFRPTLRTLPFQILPTLSTPVVLGMKFLENVNLIVDQVNKSVSWTEAEKQHTIIEKQWSNSRTV